MAEKLTKIGRGSYSHCITSYFHNKVMFFLFCLMFFDSFAKYAADDYSLLRDRFFVSVFFFFFLPHSRQ